MISIQSIALVTSGGIIVGSIVMAHIGARRHALSRRAAAVLSGVGVGVGCGIFVFYGFSNGNWIGSIYVTLVSGLVGGIAIYLAVGEQQ